MVYRIVGELLGGAVDLRSTWTAESGCRASLERGSTLAERHGLTVYDVAYLEIASRRKIALATLDRQLRAAAVKDGVQLLGG
jgi:predicted nucleic acid-binding protein